MEKLSYQDYEDIHRVLHQTMVPPDMYRRQVLHSLSYTFGYDKSIFWISDSHGHLAEPTTNNIHDHIIDLYCCEFYQMDILSPANLKETMRRKQVIGIQDVMKPSTYENSIYYQSFMKEFGYYDELGVYLVYQGQLIGAIGLVRYEHEARFNHKDALRMEFLAKSFAFTLANYQVVEEIGAQKKTLEILSNASSMGQVVFNSSLMVSHSNAAAQEFCSSYYAPHAKRNPVSHFLQEVLGKENWKLGMIKSIILPTQQEVSLHVMRVDSSKDLFVAYLRLIDKKDESVSIKEQLTSKEQEILAYITKGYTNEEISKQLYISVNTVKRHLQNIYRKLGVSNRTSLSYLVKK